MDYSVATDARAILDEAAILALRRGRAYVGVEFVFEALLTRPELLPDSFAQTYVLLLVPSLNKMRQEEWQGVAPVSPDGEVYYTPRAQRMVRDSARLAQHYRKGPMTPVHLLVVIASQDGSEVCDAIDACGVDRKEIVKELSFFLLKNDSVSQSADTVQQAVDDETPSEDADKPTIAVDSFLADLTQAARNKEISRALGRDKEMFKIAQILMRKEKSSVIITGEPGVGKTKIVEGIACDIVKGNMAEMLGASRILELNVSALMSGTELRGSFESKILALLEELENSSDTILFIDEIHLIMGSGATDGDSLDMANLLKPALGRGKLRCIGATTSEEYRKFIAKDPALERRFQSVNVEGLSLESTHALLKKMQHSFERHHGVSIGTGTMSHAIRLSERYLSKRQQPDKAIDIVDQACARFHLKMVLAETNPTALKATIDPRIAGKVTPHDVRKVVSDMTSISLDDLNVKERSTLTDLEALLNQRILGQERAVSQVVPPIQKSKIGMSSPDRPDAVMFFMGPTGVGKTQLAKELAGLVFGSADLLHTFDMSEYVEENSVARILGAPPGYVGHEEDSALYVYMLNTPYSIVLFDEIEKAHPSVYDILLPMLEEGRLTDSKGREVSLKNAIILFTSNIGADSLDREDSEEESSRRLMEALQKHFRTELLNRIDTFVPFFPLRQEDVRKILRQFIDDIRRRLQDKKIGVRMYESTYQYLGELGFDAVYGARELRRSVERYIADPISELLLKGQIGPGDTIDIQASDGRLSYKRSEKKKSRE
ncbi:MAG: ATP-dependent Clp protease ATP-binding subunit [Candidatus Hydrogenedentota bacterium]